MSKKEKFKIGDLVTIKSGGPEMTIEDVSEEKAYAQVVYFGTTDCGLSFGFGPPPRSLIRCGYPKKCLVLAESSK